MYVQAFAVLNNISSDSLCVAINTSMSGNHSSGITGISGSILATTSVQCAKASNAEKASAVHNNTPKITANHPYSSNPGNVCTKRHSK